MSYILNPNTNKRKLGTSYEVLAKKYLEQQNYAIIKMNYRCKSGEIDIIAKDEAYTVFVEVKYRTSNKYGYPRESVNYYKQKHIIAAAKYYLYTHHLYDSSCRFDVIEICYDKITHLKNAFMER